MVYLVEYRTLAVGTQKGRGPNNLHPERRGGWNYRLAFQGGWSAVVGNVNSLRAFTPGVAYQCRGGKHLGIGNSKVTLGCLIWVNSHCPPMKPPWFPWRWSRLPFPSDWSKSEKITCHTMRGRAFVGRFHQMSSLWPQENPGKTKLVKPLGWFGGTSPSLLKTIQR